MPAINSGPTFARQRDVFLEALDQPDEAARAAFLDRETAGDPSMRAVVESLLAQHRADDSFLEAPATDIPREMRVIAEVARLNFAGEQAGDTIGRYKLLQVIGEGGCGTVFLAEQHEPVRRRVALKLIKLGMDTHSVVARFEAERQALALMDHPGIARVFDGGATPTGRPFFVMELVRGIRITEYCEGNHLRIREKIALFIQLCYAIQHAHQKGVIHRDIKPSNVLVTEQDGKALPKVIDFGIAKAIEEPLTEKTLFTNFHAFIGTPAYTSPEQAQMTGADVDTRSDIYSLGVLLYEMLAGVTPFDPKELTRSGLDEMRRIIREQEPERLSTRVAKRARISVPIAERARTTEGLPAIDPDLDWIILKCLEKDRTRRYATAQELAADLQRYLDHEPIQARPPSPIYLLRKSFYRHRTTVLALAGVALALMIGAGLSIWQAIRATTAEHAAQKSEMREAALRRKAERERERALESQRRAELNEYIADINLAHQGILSDNLARAADLLRKHSGANQENLRGFEWRYLWKLAQGDEHTILAQEPSSVLCLAVNSADLLAVGQRDETSIYSLKTGEMLKRLPHIGTSLSFSSTGLLGGFNRNSLSVWRVGDWTEDYASPGYGSPLAFNRNGSRLALFNRAGLEILDSRNGSVWLEIPEVHPPFSFAPDGIRIIAHTRDGIKIWDALSGRETLTLENSSNLVDHGWVMDKPVLQFSPDGRLIVSARGSRGKYGLEVWDAKNGRHLASMPGEREAPEHTGVITAVTFSKEATTVATASWDHSIRLWDLETRRSIRKFQGSLAEVWSLVFAPDDEHLISGAKDGTVALWPLKKAETNGWMAGAWIPLNFSKDGRQLAAMRPDNTLVIFNFDLQKIEEEHRLPGVQTRFFAPFLRPEISVDLQTLALPITPHTIRILNRRTGETKDFDAPETLGRFDVLTLSPDGMSLVAGRRGELLWWKVQGGEAPKEIPGDRAFFSRESGVLLTTSGEQVRVWNAETAAPVGSFRTEAAVYFSAALSNDGRILATGSNPQEVENAIRLWDARTGKPLGICLGHTQGVGPLAFAPDGRTLASSSTDGTVRLWSVATQQQLLSIPNAVPISEILFSPDGRRLLAKSPRSPEILLLNGAK